MRRSCASIPTNIAEGCGRDGPLEFVQFMRMVMGSASELEYQLLLARDLRMLSDDTCVQHVAAVEEVKMMLSAYLQTIKQNSLTSEF
jgi:four helix bundle protein